MAYDLIVIGAGPGGYVCAIKAAQLGLSVAVVEKRATFGGTCLNVGCIPSKALLHTSEMFAQAAHDFPVFGIRTEPKLDLKAMQAHKDAVVKANVDGVAFLFKKNKIDAFRGTGRILGRGRVEVSNGGGNGQTLEAASIVIATGSESTPLPGVAVDEKTVVTSTGALELQKVPKRLLVVGAGIIGLELGSVWARLGAAVTVVEFLDRILPGMDSEICRNFQRMLKKQGLDIRLSRKVTGVKKAAKGLRAAIAPASGDGEGETVDADVVLVSIGRRPFTDGVGLEDAGVELDAKGRVVVDQHYRSSVEGIYAIGDVIAGPMLAHKGEDEGVAVAELLAGQAGHVNYEVIPNVVYTEPEIAALGKTEDELKESGADYRVGKFPFLANGRARAMLATDGLVKVLADAKTDKLIGVHILGRGAGEMIHEAAAVMEFGGSSEDMARICHAHPTMSEAVKEAALATFFKPIHA